MDNSYKSDVNFDYSQLVQDFYEKSLNYLSESAGAGYSRQVDTAFIIICTLQK